MGGGKRPAALAQELLDLKCAAGVGGGQEVRRNREDVVHLARADLCRALRLDEVVDAGASAALVAVGNLDELEARDSGKKPARLFPDPLRVGEMARVVV